MRALIVADSELLDRLTHLTLAEKDQITAACTTLNRIVGWSPSWDFVPIDVADVMGIKTLWDTISE